MSSRGISSTASDRAYNAALVMLLCCGVAAAAAAATAIPLDASPDVLVATAVIAALAAMAEWMRERLPGNALVGLEIAPVVAAIAVGGAWSGLFVTAVLVALLEIRDDGFAPARCLLNLGSFVCSTSIASLVWVAIEDNAGPSASSWLVAGLAAGFAFHLTNAATLTPNLALANEEPVGATFRAIFAWMIPHALMLGAIGAGMGEAWTLLGVPGLLVFAAPGVAMVVAIRHVVRHTQEQVAEAERHSATLQAQIEENQLLLARLNAQHMAVISGLAQAIDAKDPYTSGHTERVAAYAKRVAEAMGLEPDVVKEIEHGAVLHDIGKIGVPDHVLNKAGKLSAAEWDAMRRHPAIACSILDGMALPDTVIAVVRWHHENLDGTGYPDRLEDADIPPAARIARVVDAFDAMTTNRPYRDALPLDEAIEELRRCAGSQFDPAVVEIMIALIEQGEISVSDHSSDRVAAD